MDSWRTRMGNKRLMCNLIIYSEKWLLPAVHVLCNHTFEIYLPITCLVLHPVTWVIRHELLSAFMKICIVLFFYLNETLSDMIDKCKFVIFIFSLLIACDVVIFDVIVRIFVFCWSWTMFHHHNTTISLHHSTIFPIFFDYAYQQSFYFRPLDGTTRH